MDSDINPLVPLPSGYFPSNIANIIQGKPEDLCSFRKHLETAINLPAKERPSAIHQVDHLATNPEAFSSRSKKEIAIDKLAKEANLRLQQHTNLYYTDLEASIEELHKLKSKHQAYITECNSQKGSEPHPSFILSSDWRKVKVDGQEKLQCYWEKVEAQEKPKSYLHLVEKIQTPMPFRSFTESRPPSDSNSADDYLKFETSVLNKLRGIDKSNSTSTDSKKEAENYELHQQRIINTLKTINESDNGSDLNLRLAFINLYLQASESRIKQETAPIEREALLDKTVKFLDTNLIPLKKNSFPSEDAAQKYAQLFLQTIVHIKEINKEFSLNTSLSKTNDKESLSNSLYLVKSLLLKKTLGQINGLITVNNLELVTKKELLSNSNLKNNLGEDLIVELNNDLLKSILEKEKFSSYGTDASSSTALWQTALKFISGQAVSAKNYHQEDLFKVILMYLKESKNDRSFFFEFLHQMIAKTPEIFTKFQNAEISNDNNQFKEFKNLLLDHLELPSNNTAKNTLTPIDTKKFEFMQTESADTQEAITHFIMGRSLLSLMQFKDVDIQKAARTFYVKTLKEAKSISCVNGLLQPLASIESLHLETTGKPSVYDLVSFTKEDLAKYLQENYVIKKHPLLQVMGNQVPQINSSEDLNLLDTYRQILGIPGFTQNLSRRNTPPTFFSQLPAILGFRTSK